MSGANPYQQQINEVDFPERLDQHDSAAWDVLLRYVRDETARRLYRRPVAGDRICVIEERSSDACFIIIDRLHTYARTGAFSAWVDTILSHTLIGAEFKQVLQATSRFLAVAVRLTPAQLTALHAIIERCEANERGLLLAATQGSQPSARTGAQRLLWCRARRTLLCDQDFLHLLQAVAPTLSQAGTLLQSYQIWSHQILSLSEMSDDQLVLLTLRDSGSAALDQLIASEDKSTLLSCLAELFQAAPNKAYAIVRHILFDETSSQIAQSLGDTNADTVRQWIKRGLQSLRMCIQRKSDREAT